MVSHTTRTATTATPPVRGRGRGRPRLYARGSSSGTGSRRKLPPPKPTEYSPVGRRRPQFHNAYRPGGAGGGGRYIHPDTGEEVSATVYKEAVKNEDKLDVAVSTIKRSAPPRLQPPPVGSDGVYKPREERSYIEFHPSFNIDQILPVYSAEEIDGENYTPPQPTETRTVKILDIKEEEELRNDFPDISPSKHLPEFGNSELTTGLNSTSSYFHRTTYDESPKHTLTEERCVSPVSPSNIATRTLTTDTSITDLSLSMAASSCGMPNNFAFMMNNSTFGSIVSPIPHIDGIAIDPALAALTPPPLPLKGSLGVPIDPALSAVDQPQPVQPQTQTPAATPTDGPAKDDGGSSSTPPPPLILKTPAAQTGISPPKRGLNDVPTLASLRAHRTTAGKPPPRSIPPATTRKPRMQNQNTHEQLNLRAPSYRKIQPFRFPWSGEVGSGGPCGLNNPQSSNNALTISDTMIAVGYQQSSQFECSETLFRDHPDSGVDEELGISEVDLVEYDMDEQDDKWLTTCNSHRMLNNNNTISREIFEFALTKIEKEWISLERKMPKVQAKPHGAGVSSRRRNSGRGGEDEDDEGAEDSKCVICDDGECENANAIVFCDGCNLAVHQECYGVPYIPEGQWHCRKCQQIPRKTANCVFCPNTDGAFKQTTTNRWAHLLCAIWIPEVRLANPSFMEPVEGVDLVPKSRWKLNCYICKQKMGACIQCSNRNCFLAFHVTCGRRARLHMKMKNSSGPGAQLESSGLKALCDRHVPPDWRKENDVDTAIEEATEFYAANFTGYEWGDSRAAAVARIGSVHEDDVSHNPKIGDKRKAPSEPTKIWKLPSGAPIIPRILYNTVAVSLSRFNISNVEDFAAEACKYWTLKRESRRGASLVRRLQVQADSNSFTTLEVIRKNYTTVGRTQGSEKLVRRKDFASSLEKDLLRIISFVRGVRGQEENLAKEVDNMRNYVDATYFPELPLMRKVLNQADELDHKDRFVRGLSIIRHRLETRLYPSVSAFLIDLQSVFRSSPHNPKLGFEIRVKDYVLPASLPEPAAGNQADDAATGEMILHALQAYTDEAIFNENQIWKTMPGSPTKKARIAEQSSANRNTPAPSVDPVQEGSQKKPESKSDASDSGGPLLRTVLAAIVNDLTTDRATNRCLGGPYCPSNQQQQASAQSVQDGQNSRTLLTNGAEKGAAESGDAAKYDADDQEMQDAMIESHAITILSENHKAGDAIDANQLTNVDTEDQQMEDVLDEAVGREISLELTDTKTPNHISDDRIPIYDEVAEELEQEIEKGNDETNSQGHITPVSRDAHQDEDSAILGFAANHSTLPDMDEADCGDEVLLGGYRPEDLPSPIGTINKPASLRQELRGVLIDNTSILAAPNFRKPMELEKVNVREMIEVSETLEVTEVTQMMDITEGAEVLEATEVVEPTSPEAELPQLVQETNFYDKVDLEVMTNTSVLSDYPEDFDENQTYDLGDDHEYYSAPSDGRDDANTDDDQDDEEEEEPEPEPKIRTTIKRLHKDIPLKRGSHARFGRSGTYGRNGQARVR